MNCGEQFNHGHGSSSTCGKRVWGENSPVGVCEKCREDLIVRMANGERLSSFDADFIDNLIAKRGKS